MSTGPPASSNASRTLVIALALVLCVFAVYWNSLHGPWLFDDGISIVENPNIRSFSPLSSVLSGPAGSGASGRPLVALSLALNYAISELAPFGFHLFNVIVHALATVLLFDLLRRAFGHLRDSGRSACDPLTCAAIGAGLFALHPLATDALNHVIYRHEAMASMFLIATLAATDRALSTGLRRWAGVAIACAFAAVASKEIGYAAPLCALAYARCVLPVRDGKNAWFFLGLFASWGLLAVLFGYAERGTTVGFEGTDVSALQSLATQSGVFLHYMRLVFWPHPLVIDYGDWPIASGLGAMAPQVAATCALFLSACWLVWKRYAVGAAAISVFLVLAPTTSFVPLTGEIAAEHRLYFPTAAICAALVAIVGHLAAGRRAWKIGALAGAGLLLAATGTLTYQRNLQYRDALTIWTDTVSKRPGNARAWEHLGITYAELAASNVSFVEDAIKATARSVEIDPGNAAVQHRLASLYTFNGDSDLAARHLAEVQRLDPSYAKKLLGYGKQLIALGRVEEGAARLRSALDIQPRMIEAAALLIEIRAASPQATLRNGNEAIAVAEALVNSVHPPHPLPFDLLAMGLAEAGRFEEAERTARRALKLAEQLSKEPLARAIRARIELYVAQRPFRRN